MRRASAGARCSRSRRGGPGSGSGRTERSSSRPRRPHGLRTPFSSSRSGSTPRCADRDSRSAGFATSCGSCSSACRASVSSCASTTQRRSASTRRSAWPAWALTVPSSFSAPPGSTRHHLRRAIRLRHASSSVASIPFRYGRSLSCCSHPGGGAELPEGTLMERAIFVRHGESDYSARALVNGDPSVVVGLTEEGKQQARWLYDRLESDPINHSAATEFGRTRETADLALGDRAVPRIVLRDLNDPFYGSFEGKPLAEYRKWAGSHGPLDVPPGQGEARAAIAERYARAFRALLARDEETILVVCHSLPIAFALAAADGRRPSAQMPLVTPAEPHILYEPSLREAADRIEEWVQDPVYP